ncbi:MAG: hypothetical protein KA314_13735 [Chloroflexi bacterium]|nr:hypothetical protein [Chloroflexota bacterium]MBP8056894.1 hypothetical protein [Chloroflexota bacterium]
MTKNIFVRFSTLFMDKMVLDADLVCHLCAGGAAADPCRAQVRSNCFSSPTLED